MPHLHNYQPNSMSVYALKYITPLLLLYSSAQATVTMIVDEDIQECGNGYPLPHIDLSQTQIFSGDDGTLTVNGTARYTDDYGGPTNWKMYTKRLERGQWVTGIISREVFDLCPILGAPTELWTPLVSKLYKRTCPFQKGYEEHMNMINLGNPAKFLNIPPEFVGEWKVFHEITTTRRGLPTKECFMAFMSITEV